VLAQYPGADPTRRPPSIDALTHDQLATFIKQLREEGPVWVSQVTDDAPRRRLVFAALVLDAADAGQWWNRVEYDQVASIRAMRAVRPLIEDACAVLRANPMGQPERLWMLASVAYGQGARDSTLLLPGRNAITHERGNDHLAHARMVLPADLRLKLASAMTLELADDEALLGEHVMAVTGQLRVVPMQLRRRVIDAMDALTQEPPLAAEAHLHIAFQQFLMGDTAAALASFKKASLAEDPYVRYLAFLFAGRLLNRLGDSAAAEGNYRLALTALPRTQSGVESLAALLMLRGDRVGAATLVDEMFAGPRGELDPWFTFIQGDYRRLPEYMTAIRRGGIR
jgi:tetratricopeptide (TPR) repeat protein